MKAREKFAPIYGLVAVALFAGFVETIVDWGFVSPLILPPPSSLPAAFARLWREDLLLQPIAASLAQSLAATGLAALVGLPAGYLLWRRPLLGLAYEPWLGAAFAAPIILLYPLFLVIFGRGYATTIFVGFLSGVIPVILKTREGLLGVPPVLLNVGRSLHMGEIQTIRRIALPAAAPGIFTGLRLALIYALVNIVGLEFLIDFGGLGRVVSDMYFRYEIPAMYAAILLVVLVSLALLQILRRLERRFRPE
jgi:NitT/TauT family transport system permease protein